MKRGMVYTRPDTHGSRIYVTGHSVNKVRKTLGKLAKKVRLAADGSVEVIHTHNGIGNRIQPGLYKLLAKLELLK